MKDKLVPAARISPCLRIFIESLLSEVGHAGSPNPLMPFGPEKAIPMSAVLAAHDACTNLVAGKSQI